MARKYLVIINPISGTGGKSTLPHLIAETLAPEADAFFISYTRGEGHAAKLATEAAAHGFDTIIAVGGDGTVNEIAAALYGTHTALGIIPKGSGNGLARAMGIPLDKEAEALAIIKTGKYTEIDTGLANGTPFFCTFGVGFDAAVTERYEDAASRGIFTYIKATIDEYLRFEPKSYLITTAEGTFKRKAQLITCANIDQYGSNAYIAPGASPSDGLLDLVILRPVEGLQAAQVAIQLFTKRIRENARLESVRGSSFVIERAEEGIVQIDGESRVMGRRIEIGIEPRSLRLLVP